MPNDKIEQRNVYRDKRQSHLRAALIFSIQRVKILIIPVFQRNTRIYELNKIVIKTVFDTCH